MAARKTFPLICASRKTFPLICASRVREASKTAPIFNKYSGKAFADVGLASRDEINECFEKAHEAKDLFGSLRPHARTEILSHLQSLIKQNSNEFARLIAQEAGKPIAAAEMEVSRCISTIGDAIKEAQSATPDGNWREFTSELGRYSILTRRFPIGVASFVTPFNFPLNLAMHKVGPAIAAGCPFVLKPSDQAPLSAVFLGELLAQTNIPEGAFSILPCAPEDAPLFSENKRIKVISFTGSPKVGWGIKERSTRQKVILELGGNAATIVDKNISDLDSIVSRLMVGAFAYSGQACIAVKRILVHESHYDLLCSKLAAEAEKWNNNQGDPLDRKTLLGPVISEDQAKFVETVVNDAVNNHGGKIVVGGKRNGSIYDATVIADVDKDARVWKEEIFGPVTTIHKYEHFKDAIDMVNDSEFGLQAGLFTNDLQKTFYAFENLEVGGVVINDVSSARVDVQPYGGVKSSGCGREGAKYAIEDLTEIRTMVMKEVGTLPKE